jgi:hypothetical protein
MASVVDVAACALGKVARKRQHLGEEHDLASCSAHANWQRPASACLCVQEVKTRLAYVTRRKLHKAKREQQKKLKALEERRQVCCLIVHGTALQHKVRLSICKSLRWSTFAVAQSQCCGNKHDCQHALAASSYPHLRQVGSCLVLCQAAKELLFGTSA